MALRSIDKLLKRWRKEGKEFEDNRPPQLYVFAVNFHRFETWCRYNGIRPYGKDVHGISTGAPSVGMRGFKLRPEDRIVVLEAAELGREWQKIRKDTLVASSGWVDIEERQETLV